MTKFAVMSLSRVVGARPPAAADDDDAVLALALQAEEFAEVVVKEEDDLVEVVDDAAAAGSIGTRGGRDGELDLLNAQAEVCYAFVRHVHMCVCVCVCLCTLAILVPAAPGRSIHLLQVADPTPDVRALFIEYDRLFFGNALGACEVKWSRRMTLCAGICRYDSGGYCRCAPCVAIATFFLKKKKKKEMSTACVQHWSERAPAPVPAARGPREHADP